MASLRETKDRIGSVKSTLKITSAMKLVASSKLRKAQNAIEAFRPYEALLQNILASCFPQAEYSLEATENRGNAASEEYSAFGENGNETFEEYSDFGENETSNERGDTVVVAIASNSSLCGGFNANVIRKAVAVAVEEKATAVYSLGRKMAEAMKKAGYASPEDLNGLVAHPGYEDAGELARELCGLFFDGKVSKILLVYNHFVSTSRQDVVVEQYLPFDVSSVSSDETADPDLYILEPDAETIVKELTPKVLRMKLYAAILDSVAAEHAARTVAMQAATDNARDLLADLTLEYNKGRQQKITAEILDLMGGAANQ